MKLATEILVIYLLVINCVAFILYGSDKHKAKKGKWRIPEKTLLGIAFAGGALGALLGMKAFHHKTLHTSFRFGVPCALILWILFISYLYGKGIITGI